MQSLPSPLSYDSNFVVVKLYTLLYWIGPTKREKLKLPASNSIVTFSLTGGFYRFAFREWQDLEFLSVLVVDIDVVIPYIKCSNNDLLGMKIHILWTVITRFSRIKVRLFHLDITGIAFPPPPCAIVSYTAPGVACKLDNDERRSILCDVYLHTLLRNMHVGDNSGILGKFSIAADAAYGDQKGKEIDSDDSTAEDRNVIGFEDGEFFYVHEAVR